MGILVRRAAMQRCVADRVGRWGGGFLIAVIQMQAVLRRKATNTPDRMGPDTAHFGPTKKPRMKHVINYLLTSKDVHLSKGFLRKFPMQGRAMTWISQHTSKYRLRFWMLKASSEHHATYTSSRFFFSPVLFFLAHIVLIEGVVELSFIVPSLAGRWVGQLWRISVSWAACTTWLQGLRPWWPLLYCNVFWCFLLGDARRISLHSLYHFYSTGMEVLGHDPASILDKDSKRHTDSTSAWFKMI